MEYFTIQKEIEMFLKKVKHAFSNEEKPFNAKSAWFESTYGIGSYQTIDERIDEKKAEIRKIVKSKFAQNNPNNPNAIHSSYHCLIDIEEDLYDYVDVIFDELRKEGFDIIDLHEDCKSKLIENGCYLLSWKYAFQSDRKYQPKEK